MNNTVIVVDDSPNIRLTIKNVLEDQGYQVVTCETGEAAIQKVQEEIFEAMLLDVKLPGIDGLTALKKIIHIQPALKVIMISGHADLETAVKATRLGIYNFLEKPLQPEKLLLELKNIFDRQQIESEMHQLKKMVNLDYQLIGSSPVMQKLFLEIEKAAPTDGRIFIFGENGTGKELVAREIHRRSLRAREPFIKINCAAIPKELIESELFGHEKGAFTGAIQRKIGVFETANRGTLLLDEIGDMALETQAKLLRVLQENEFVRVGGTTPISFNIRIISATNKDLKALIAAGQFREDLYFRVNVVPIFVAPLQEHREDIPVLIRYFLTDYSKKNGKPIKQITEEALIPFMEYRWPGNIRELRNIIERLVIMADRAVVSYRDVVNFLPELMLKGEGKIHTGSDLMELENPLSLKEYLDQFEKRLLEHHFIKAQKNVSRLSQNLSTDRANLHRKLKKYGIK